MCFFKRLGYHLVLWRHTQLQHRFLCDFLDDLQCGAEWTKYCSLNTLAHTPRVPHRVWLVLELGLLPQDLGRMTEWLKNEFTISFAKLTRLAIFH